MDHFTWAEAYPLKDHKAPAIANVLVRQLFSRFGMPYELLSDQVSEIRNEPVLDFCKRLAIDKIGTCRYRPACNFMHERYHRTLH